MKQLTLRPHDVAVALQLVIAPQNTYAEQSVLIGLAASEVHQSVGRLRIARLLGPSARQIRRKQVEEFIVSGVPYVFPAQLGTAVRGIPTSHSGPGLREHFAESAPSSSVEDVFVWPSENGKIRGIAITPLYAGAVGTEKKNPALYKLLVLVDALRIGKARERRIAKSILSHALNIEYA